MSRQHDRAVSFDGLHQGFVVDRTARADKLHIQRCQSRARGRQPIEELAIEPALDRRPLIELGQASLIETHNYDVRIRLTPAANGESLVDVECSSASSTAVAYVVKPAIRATLATASSQRLRKYGRPPGTDPERFVRIPSQRTPPTWRRRETCSDPRSTGDRKSARDRHRLASQGSCHA